MVNLCLSTGCEGIEDCVQQFKGCLERLITIIDKTTEDIEQLEVLYGKEFNINKDKLINKINEIRIDFSNLNKLLLSMHNFILEKEKQNYEMDDIDIPSIGIIERIVEGNDRQNINLLNEANEKYISLIEKNMSIAIPCYLSFLTYRIYLREIILI